MFENLASIMEAYQKMKQKEYEEEKQNESKKEDDDPCWDGYRMIGMKEKDGKKVPNCVPDSKDKE